MSNSTALATASASAVHAVAAAVDTDTTVTTLVQARTTYTVTTLRTNVVEFYSGRVRFQLAMEVTRTTSRSTKTFQVHVSADNYTGHDGMADTLHINTVYNENGNAVYAAEFDGYRAAAMAHAVQVTTTALETASVETASVETSALGDTVVETVRDPETGGRTLTPEVRETLRRGPVQDQETALEDTAVETVLDPETGGRTLDTENVQETTLDAEREAATGVPADAEAQVTTTAQETILDPETGGRTLTPEVREASLAREAEVKDTLAQSLDHLQAAAQARHDHLVEWEAHLQAWGQGQAESHHAGAAQVAHTRYRRAMRAYWDGVTATSHGDLYRVKQAAESGDLAGFQDLQETIRAAVEVLEVRGRVVHARMESRTDGETDTQGGEVAHAAYAHAHAHEYVTAEQMVTLQLHLADPAQPSLPDLLEPRHQVLILLDPLDCEPDPNAWRAGGAWWEVERAATTVCASLEVQDGDTEDRVERAAMEAVTRLFPTVEWFDLDQLERQRYAEPHMGDREAAVFDALNVHDGPLAHDNRRWVGLSGIYYHPAVTDW